MPSRRNIKEFLLYLLRSAVANLIHLLQVVGNPGFLFAFEARVNTRFSWFNKGKPTGKKNDCSQSLHYFCNRNFC